MGSVLNKKNQGDEYHFLLVDIADEMLDVSRKIFSGLNNVRIV